MFDKNSSVNLSQPSALWFVVLLGVVSLLADVTYEGARSIAGPFLAFLGASGTVVGFVAGFGELTGYGLRLFSGVLADRTQRYWTLTIVGYTINLLAVPLLAFAGHWPMAAALLVAERAGKAIRNPARDAMLSHATQTMGRGWGFGLHEAMDQIGAVLGPLLMALAAGLHQEYRTRFALLAIPAVLALAVLLSARWLYPRPRDLEVKTLALQTEGLSRRFWIYLLAIGCIAAGYADFPLIAFHWGRTGVVPAVWIPILYAIAMGVDALAALWFGHLFDRRGTSVLIPATLLSCGFAPLVFRGGFYSAILGMALWGVGMGVGESVMRAAVAQMVPADRRGTAYGVFNTGYGVFWFAGSALMGWLYDRSLAGLIIFSMAAQLASIPLLLSAKTQLSARS